MRKEAIFRPLRPSDEFRTLLEFLAELGRVLLWQCVPYPAEDIYCCKE